MPRRAFIFQMPTTSFLFTVTSRCCEKTRDFNCTKSARQTRAQMRRHTSRRFSHGISHHVGEKLGVPLDFVGILPLDHDTQQWLGSGGS